MEKDNNRFKITAKLILYALPIMGILGLLIPTIIGQFNLTLLGSYLAIPMIVAPLIYHKYKDNTSDSIELNNRIFILLLSVYFICIFLATIIVYISEVRPILFYLIVTIMSLIILFEILLFNDSNMKTKVILFQSMILMLCILWSVNLNYFYYISRTDPIFHVAAIESLINNAYIEAEIFEIYKPFPLWHVLCTMVYYISALDLPIQKIMFFTNGIIYSFTPVITYLISRKIFSNNKVSLLSALFIVLNPDVIGYGMASISRSVVSFLFLLLILSLLYKSNLKMVFLSIMLIFPIVMYHTASTPFIFTILLLLLIGQHIYDKNKNIFTYNFLVIFIIFNLLYWMFYAELLFETIISTIIREAPSGIITSSIIYTPLNELFNYLQYTPMLFFVIIGTLGTLYSNRLPSIAKIFVLLGLLSVVVAFPGPALLINKFAGNFNVGRFGQYLFPFITFAIAIGFYTMYKTTQKYSKSFLLLLFISLAFLSVSNDFIASDNPIIERPFYTYYLTEQEINSFNTIGIFTSGSIMSDYVTTRYTSLSNTPHSDKRHILVVDSTNMKVLREKDNDVFLIRQSELSKRPLKLYSNTDGYFKPNPSWEGGSKIDYYYKDLSLWNDFESYNKVYDTKSILAFT
ncbi:hypothetical protein [Methanolobus psychrotolerans]|uniref:hypothetical protein n=1 Tax=Methanolobus psychrotolerans TaxID=1874706 RepID=UPI000B91797D|nr:hypothetical protein [Methanolobus psychrotolerans]